MSGRDFRQARINDTFELLVADQWAPHCIQNLLVPSHGRVRHIVHVDPHRAVSDEPIKDLPAGRLLQLLIFLREFVQVTIVRELLGKNKISRRYSTIDVDQL
ncbi:MAG TPA: hypothetical protein VGE08_20865 [Steroidobacter sp.]